MILVTDPIGSCSSGFSPTRYLPLLASISAQAWASISGACVGEALSGAVLCWASARLNPAPPSEAPGTDSSANVIKTSATVVFRQELFMDDPCRIDLFLSTVRGRDRPPGRVSLCVGHAAEMVPSSLLTNRPNGIIDSASDYEWSV
jgi:hypothetical protein